MKVHHKFCSYNICSSFSAGSIYKGAKHTLQCMPNKNLQIPRSFIVHVWHFQWKKFETQYLDNIYVSISWFFKMYWGFCTKNIMTLMLKTLIWDYSWGKVKPIYIHRSGQWNYMSSWILVYVLLELHRCIQTRKFWMEEGNACFEAKLRKHKLLSSRQ